MHLKANFNLDNLKNRSIPFDRQSTTYPINIISRNKYTSYYANVSGSIFTVILYKATFK